MNEDREHDLQDWFDRSVEELPRQPFTAAVVDGVRRRQRLRQVRRYAAVLIAFFSVCLLLPDLIVPLNLLATLPLRVLAAGGEQWLLLVIPVMGVVYLAVMQARHAGYIRGR